MVQPVGGVVEVMFADGEASVHAYSPDVRWAHNRLVHVSVLQEPAVSRVLAIASEVIISHMLPSHHLTAADAGTPRVCDVTCKAHARLSASVDT